MSLTLESGWKNDLKIFLGKLLISERVILMLVIKDVWGSLSLTQITAVDKNGKVT